MPARHALQLLTGSQACVHTHLLFQPTAPVPTAKDSWSTCTCRSKIVDAVTHPPRLWAAEGPLKQQVLPHVPLLHQPYRPSPWAINTHAQVCMGPRTTSPLYALCRWVLPDLCLEFIF